MQNSKTITILFENKLGVIYRIVDLFLRKRIAIETMRVEKHDGVLSKMTLEIEADEQSAEKLKKQIRKVIEVLEVS